MSNSISDWQVGLYVAAVLIPLAAFAVQAIFIRQLKRLNAYIATGAIVLSCSSAGRLRRVLPPGPVVRTRCRPPPGRRGHGEE